MSAEHGGPVPATRSSGPAVQLLVEQGPPLDPYHQTADQSSRFLAYPSEYLLLTQHEAGRGSEVGVGRDAQIAAAGRDQLFGQPAQFGPVGDSEPDVVTRLALGLAGQCDGGGGRSDAQPGPGLHPGPHGEVVTAERPAHRADEHDVRLVAAAPGASQRQRPVTFQHGQ